MFSILDGRAEFFQWDIDRKLIVNDSSIKEVHFCNKTEECSLVVATYTEDGVTLANVPNILLQTDWKIRVYGYTGDFTKYEQSFKVNKRSKPSDYVYTETEVLNYDALLERVEALENSEALNAHLQDTNNPHKITPELIKAFSNQAKKVEFLDMEALETGIYLGKEYWYPEEEEEWANTTEYLCLTLSIPEENRIFQILFDECYGLDEYWDYYEDNMHTYPYHPTIIVRYYHKEYEQWNYGFLNLDMLERLKEELGNHPTYDDLWYEFEWFYNEYIAGVSGPRIYEGEYGHTIVEYNDRIELFATEAENISHNPNTGLAIQFPIEINIEPSDTYNAQATISACDGKETINSVNVTSQWVWIGFNTDLPEDDITQSHYVEAYLHIIKFFDVEEEE